MTANYNATRDPRTGRPVPKETDLPKGPPQASAQEPSVQAQRDEHHEEGIPPFEVPSADLLEEEAETVTGEPPAAMRGDREPEDTNATSYQVSIENPSIAAKDWVLVASGVVNIEEYRGEEFVSRITVDVCVEAEQDMSIADANTRLLDAAVDSLRTVCALDKEVLHGSLVV
jgi:hypothetical protein